MNKRVSNTLQRDQIILTQMEEDCEREMCDLKETYEKKLLVQTESNEVLRYENEALVLYNEQLIIYKYLKV
jgi:hypothetical protein